ncbi:hypothetical protein Lal_00011119 [Lupinus albus]|nr:hypothetical protein Lal_00011119 [Lupinus albus]
MLWDEPTASLDPILVREVLVVMEELAKYRSSAMLVVTHEIPFALHVADRIVLMEEGKSGRKAFLPRCLSGLFRISAKSIRN